MTQKKLAVLPFMTAKQACEGVTTKCVYAVVRCHDPQAFDVVAVYPSKAAASAHAKRLSTTLPTVVQATTWFSTGGK